jgi:glycosyltransferase involved in cell wall biosynthesis
LGQKLARSTEASSAPGERVSSFSPVKLKEIKGDLDGAKMMPIRVLMLGPGDGVGGGISALVETIMPGLRQQVDLRYLPTVKWRPLRESGKISVQNMVWAISQFARFLYTLFQFHPHIIHLHTSQGLGWLKDTFFVFVGKSLGCRIVLHMHGGNFDKLYDKNPRFMQDYTRRVMSLADAIIAVSTEWRRRLAEIVPAEHIFALKNCIAVDAISPHLANRPSHIAKALFLGRVGPRKGAFDLLEAMGRLKTRNCPLQVCIAGDEERQGDQVRAISRLEELQLVDECQLVGIVRGAEKAELLSKAGFFVLPSYDEGLPMAILEAMAAGLAVISSPVGGIPEVVRDGYNGFLITPGDIATLAEKLAMLASDPHLCEVMGQRSREIAQQELDVKLYIERLVALYESIASPSGSGRGRK